MRWWIQTGMLAAFAGPVMAQTPTFYYPLPSASAVHVRKDVTYSTTGGREVKMDVYRPAAAAAGARLPVLIFLCTLADRPQRQHPIYQGWASVATTRGLVAINPDAAPDFAAGLDALLDHVRRNADELRADPERVAVYAASGNVFRAFRVVQDPRRTGIKAAVFYYGSSESTSFRRDLPALFVRAGLDRPALNQELDDLVAAGLRANAPVRVLNHAGGHHAFEILDDDDATRDAIDRTLEFVKAAVEPRYHAALDAQIPEAEAAGAMASGDFAAAAQRYQGMVEKRPDDARLRLSYGEALLGAGRHQEARAQFDRLKGAGLGPRDLGLPAARAAIADGDAAGAVAWLKTIPKRFLPPEIASDPAFQSLRDRPDFKELFE